MKLYPLTFTPVFSYRIWGGDKLKTVLNKSYSQESIGESWEISDIKDSETVVNNGYLKGQKLKEIINTFKGDFVGQKVYDAFGNDFPLLIKFIDAKTPLSIQVHPNNQLAKQRHNAFGKNEMWYVMQAEKNAELILGFNKKINKEEYLNTLENNKLKDILNVEKVTSGDTFYIPTGRVHAIGAGVLLAEIQQTSNITYRIYDYDRVDKKTGQKRELHTNLALDAIDYNCYDKYKTDYKQVRNTPCKLVNSEYFKTNIIELDTELTRDLTTKDSFTIYMCVDGEVTITIPKDAVEYTLKMGQTIIIPACISTVVLQANYTKLIEVYL
ncbi:MULTISPECIES: type I phosphomannose isomerase catalytic subunit [Olleya]|uniref:Phosphohexomutase n=1 Tax=Olleya namhaensis TaxID=1144750 RepID=A0A1I3RSM8_9FLAO|nr:MULTISPECIES: type I phosphomannose isomerase catalytic subunit [Olleya]PKG51096.1 mannose-6-phosphate isomerase [Olleya sp. 1-3]SFJ49335.1 mannose-6-phosphate isomerase, type 1 [Olleya namhaensis]